MDGDFLLLELRELLNKHPTLKVVLMSATINHETFIKYFNGAPLLSIPGYTHPVTDIYLEDIIPQIKYRPPAARSTRKESGEVLQAFREEHKEKGLDDATISAIQIISRSERLDFQVRITSCGIRVSTTDRPSSSLPRSCASLFPIRRISAGACSFSCLVCRRFDNASTPCELHFLAGKPMYSPFTRTSRATNNAVCF